MDDPELVVVNVCVLFFPSFPAGGGGGGSGGFLWEGTMLIDQGTNV